MSLILQLSALREQPHFLVLKVSGQTRLELVGLLPPTLVPRVV
jgi:hypothetical protein